MEGVVLRHLSLNSSNKVFKIAKNCKKKIVVESQIYCTRRLRHPFEYNTFYAILTVGCNSLQYTMIVKILYYYR